MQGENAVAAFRAPCIYHPASFQGGFRKSVEAGANVAIEFCPAYFPV
jgi:hypothetical protein